MKAWLKGGLIGAGISVIFIVLNVTVPERVISSSSFVANLLFFPQIVGGAMSLVFELVSFAEDAKFPYLFVGVVNFIFYFLIGAFIGWLIGRRKSKKLVVANE